MTDKLRKNSDYIIGIDLHGTLLDERWTLDGEIIDELILLLSDLKERASIYICTGNDLTFINETIPEKIRELFEGYILENGCVLWDRTEERMLINIEEIRSIRSLQNLLVSKKLPDLVYYGKRLGTISLFTKDHGAGVSPLNLYEYLNRELADYPYINDFTITHSDVAVDILPRGYSKFNALSIISGERKIIAIADSWNDWEFLSLADLSFMPSNYSSHVENEFLKNGIVIEDILSYTNNDKQRTVYKSSSAYTRGVIDILKRLVDHL